MQRKKFNQVIKDGIALLIPIVVALYMLKVLIESLRKLLLPLTARFGIQHFLGKFTLSILAIVAIFLIIIVLGLMMELPIVARFRNAVESILLRLVPPLNQLKAMSANILKRENATQGWKPVLLKTGDKYRFAYLINETDMMGVFFVLKSQSLHDGDVEMLGKEAYKYMPVEVTEMKKSMRHFGVDVTDMIRGKME